MPKVTLPPNEQAALDELRVAAGVGGEGPDVQHRAEVVEGDGDVDVLVGVDADDDSTV